MKHDNLIKNTLLLLVNKVSLVITSFILLPVFTAHFTAAEYGLVGLIASYITLLAPILMLKLDIGILRYIVDARNDIEKIKIITSSFTYIFIPISLILFICAVVIGYIFAIPFYILIIVNLITSILYTILTQLTRGLGGTGLFVLTSIVVTILSFIVSLFGVLVLKSGIEIIFISAITAQLIGSLILYIKMNIAQYISKKMVDKATQKQLIKYSLPLVPDSMSFWVMNVSDRTILSLFLGVASAGIYTIANKFTSIVEQAIGVFFQAWTESATVYAKVKNRDELYSDIFSAYMRIFVALPVLVTAVMPFIFSLFIKGEDFQPAYVYIPILMYATVAHAAEAFISSIYIANDLTKQIAKTTIFGAVINIAINIALVMYVGIWAAAISTLLAYLITAVYRYYNVRQYGIKLHLGLGLVGSFVLIIVFNAVFYYWNSPVGNVISLVVSVIVALVLNFKLVKSGYSFIKQGGDLKTIFGSIK